MLNRRQFLSAGVITGTSLLIGSNWDFSVSESSELQTARLQRFVDPLRVPETTRSNGKMAGSPYYEIRMTQFRQRLHRQLPRTKLWGYDGVFPGPTFDVQRNEGIRVRWINDLPETHLLSVDTSLHGAQYPENPYVRTVVHLHGAKVASGSDGYPEAWFTPGESQLYYYPNRQRACSLWYHDHALGITRLNIYAGLAGFYLIRDKAEEKLNLPAGQYEIPLLLQDRSFNQDGQLRYPHSWQHTFFGRTAVVNGVVWPFLQVEARKYRFRILNGSNSRFFNIKLLRYDENRGKAVAHESGPPFFQIGTDGGLLSAPVLLNDPQNATSPRLLLGPAERADIVIDFAGYEGKSYLLHNNAKSPFRGFDFPLPDESPLPQIMLFRVKPASVPDAGLIPSRLSRIPALDPKSAVMVRDLTLDAVLDEKGMPKKLLLNGLDWHEAVTETPKLGTTEIWNLINLTAEVHPIHLHMVQFQVLDTQEFDVAEFKKSKLLTFTKPSSAPALVNSGWKDTILVNPGELIRIIVRFRGYSGKFVWHCHILEHEDNDMMRPLQILPA